MKSLTEWVELSVITFNMHLSSEWLFDPINEFNILGIRAIRYETDCASDRLRTVSIGDFVRNEIPTTREFVEVMGLREVLNIMAGLLYNEKVNKRNDIVRWEYGVMDINKAMMYLLASRLIYYHMNYRPNYALAQILSAHHLYGVKFSSNNIHHQQTDCPPRMSTRIDSYRSPKLRYSNFDPYNSKQYIHPSIQQDEVRALKESGVVYLAGVILPYNIVGFDDRGWIERFQFTLRDRTIGEEHYTHGIPGGHARSRQLLQSPFDRFPDVTALREFVEETGSDLLMTATPLCIADQFLPRLRSSEPDDPVRYLTLAWRVRTTIGSVNGERVATYGSGENIQWTGDEVRRQFKVNPITDLVLTAHRDPKRF